MDGHKLDDPSTQSVNGRCKVAAIEDNEPLGRSGASYRLALEYDCSLSNRAVTNGRVLAASLAELAAGVRDTDLKSSRRLETSQYTLSGKSVSLMGRALAREGTGAKGETGSM